MVQVMEPQEEERQVIIRVDYSDRRFRLDRDKVEVEVGQKIVWQIGRFIDPPARFIEIFFDDDSPFDWHAKRSKLGAVDPHGPWFQENRSLNAVPEVPGDYKYGIRLVAHDGTTLDDEDPYLYVYPRRR